MRRALLVPLLLLAACRRSEPPAPPPAEGPRQDVVIIVIDTLRADAVDRADTPAFDQVAARGQRVPRVWSSATWTVPSVISIFTGMSVREHGWNWAFPRHMPDGKDTLYPPIKSTPLLAEVLDEAGFHNTALVGNQTLSWPLGFDRGFDRFEMVRDPFIPGAVRDTVSGWKLEDRHFLYVHFQGPHNPLKPSEQARAKWELPESQFKGKRRLSHRKVLARPEKLLDVYARAYHAEVEDTDRRLGEVLDALGPFRERALLVVTSDHGELLGDHGQLGHDKFVWEGLTHVPFAAEGAPELPAAMRLDTLADIVSRATGVEHGWHSRLDAPLPLVSQRQDKLAFSADGVIKGIWGEEEGPGVLARKPVVVGSATRDEVEDEHEEHEEAAHDTGPSQAEAPPTLPAPIDSELRVYDLSRDPEEATRLVGHDDALRAARQAWEQATPQGAAGERSVGMPADAEEGLRALGYLE